MTPLTIPLFDLSGPTSGANQDGVHVGSITPAPAPVCLNGFHSAAGQHVVLYDTTASNSVTLVDETATINAYLAGNNASTWSFGDNTAPDNLLVDLTGSISAGCTGVVLEIKTAGTGTFTNMTPTVQYWNGTSFVNASGVSVTGSFGSAGLVQISFTALPTVAGSMPQAYPQGSAGIFPWLTVSFPNVSFTGSATMGGVWITLPAGSPTGWQNLTSVMNQTATSPSFTAQPSLVFPVVGDLFLYGSANKFARINTRNFRGASTSYAKQWVYWSGPVNGWKVFPSGTLVDSGATNQSGPTGSQTENDYSTSFLPPSDWVSQTLTDTASVAHTGYFVGLQVTSAPVMPVPPAEIVWNVQEIMGANVSGSPLAASLNLTSVSVNVEQTATAATGFLLADTTTGATASFTLPANTASGQGAVTFTGASSDGILFMTVFGAAVPGNNVSNAIVLFQGP